VGKPEDDTLVQAFQAVLLEGFLKLTNLLEETGLLELFRRGEEPFFEQVHKEPRREPSGTNPRR